MQAHKALMQECEPMETPCHMLRIRAAAILKDDWQKRSAQDRLVREGAVVLITYMIRSCCSTQIARRFPPMGFCGLRLQWLSCMVPRLAVPFPLARRGARMKGAECVGWRISKGIAI